MERSLHDCLPKMVVRQHQLRSVRELRLSDNHANAVQNHVVPAGITERVNPRSADQRVVAGATIEGIVALAALEQILAGATNERIVAVVALKVIVRRVAGQFIVPATTEHVLEVGGLAECGLAECGFDHAIVVKADRRGGRGKVQRQIVTGEQRAEVERVDAKSRVFADHISFARRDDRLENIDVVTSATQQVIAPAAASEDVIAVASREHIMDKTARQAVVCRVARESVFKPITAQHVFKVFWPGIAEVVCLQLDDQAQRLECGRGSQVEHDRVRQSLEANRVRATAGG